MLTYFILKPILLQSVRCFDEDDSDCEFVQSELYENITSLKIDNYCEFINVAVFLDIYEIECNYYDTENKFWSSQSVAPGIQQQMNNSVCLPNHLTTFGALTVPSPNTLDRDNLDLNPANNIAAICLLVGLSVIYVALGFGIRYLDNHDLKFLSSIPLCGQDGPFMYEITIKTGMGWTAGTTANVGIRLYGTEDKSGSRHLRFG